MAYVPPKDRTVEHSTSNSQTVFAVGGALDASYNAFSAHMSIGDWIIGAVVEPGVAFKVGRLTYSDTDEITVDSTGYDSKGTFSSGGTKEVFMGLPAQRAAGLLNIHQDTMGVVQPPGTAADQAAARTTIGAAGLSAANVFANTTEATGAGTTAAAIFAGGVEILKKLFVTGAAVFSAAVTALTFKQTASATTAPFLDISGQATMTIANGGNSALSAGDAALIVIVDVSSGQTAIYLGYGSVNTILVAQSGSQWVAPTASPGAGFASVAWFGSSYLLFNNTGSSHVFRAMIFKLG